MYQLLTIHRQPLFPTFLSSKVPGPLPNGRCIGSFGNAEVSTWKTWKIEGQTLLFNDGKEGAFKYDHGSRSFTGRNPSNGKGYILRIKEADLTSGL